MSYLVNMVYLMSVNKDFRFSPPIWGEFNTTTTLLSDLELVYHILDFNFGTKYLFVLNVLFVVLLRDTARLSYIS